MQTVNKIEIGQLMERKDWKKAVIVFKNGSFFSSLQPRREYNVTERSYRIYSDAKFFDTNMNGNSLYGSCLDGNDDGVRLDHYMSRLPEEGTRWLIEYCYIIE